MGGGKHKYYNGTYEHPELIKARKESDRLMSQMGQDTDNFVDDIRVMTLPFSWAEKGFFSKKVVDIETIKICVLCFTASADHENKLYRGSGGDWKPRETKEGEIIAYYLRTFERQIWYRDHQSGILNGDPAYRLYVIMANIKDVLMKVAADTDKYRKLVTSLADKE